MIKLTRAEERVVADFGWLESRHTFSSDESKPLGFGPMCVMNEHRISPGQGFKSHRRHDMEIFSCVIDGALVHKDNLGSESVLQAGDVQVVSAGAGIRHSEFNHSKTEPLHFLQIWFVPDQKGTVPRYQHKSFSDGGKRGQLRLMGSPDGREGSLMIHQDVELHAALLGNAEHVTHELPSGRMGWLQVLRGTVTIPGHELGAGDGAAFVGEPGMTVTASSDGAEVLMLNLPQGTP
jgi:quercetin 2,3-dioxygenase